MIPVRPFALSLVCMGLVWWWSGTLGVILIAVMAGLIVLVRDGR
jgi:hypothetical protein